MPLGCKDAVLSILLPRLSSKKKRSLALLIRRTLLTKGLHNSLVDFHANFGIIGLFRISLICYGFLLGHGLSYERFVYLTELTGLSSEDLHGGIWIHYHEAGAYF